jgi:hypothetical protein
MGKNHSFKRQLPNPPFRIIRGGGEGNETPCVVVHPAPDHCFRVEELEFGCPVRTRDLELLEALFGFLLAIGQSALFEEFSRVVVGGRGTPGVGILKRNQ